MNDRVKIIQRTAAVSVGSAAAASTTQELPNPLRLPLRAQPLPSVRLIRAFTLIELMFVIGTVVLAMLIIPALTPARVHRCGISCASNLKQIGLAFRMFANDYGEKFPMQINVAEDGAKELAEQGFALPIFASISNELNNPKPLNCPQDSERTRATQFQQLTVTNISYFVSLDASETNPASILAGDRNVCIKRKMGTSLTRIESPNVVRWGKRIHVNQGNIVLSDGSAHRVDDLGLRTALTNSAIATNRFVFP